MSANPIVTVERSVGRARRRLIVHRLLNAAAAGLSVGLAVGLAWLLAEPWVLQSPPEWLRWTVLGSTAGVGFVATVAWVLFSAPSRQAAALELDRRFDLRERVTTALTLNPAERDTPAGRAVVADATAKVGALPLGERFPVRPRWHAAWVPALAAGVAAVGVFYHPDTATLLGADPSVEATRTADAKKAADAAKRPVLPFTRQRPPEQLDRKKSKDLEQLEMELDKLMEKWQKDPADTDAKRREKVAELTSMEERIKKFKEEEFRKLAQTEQALQQLDRLNKDKDFDDGPLKDVQKALSKGDLKKAEDAIEELKKKIQDKKLSDADVKKLDKQLEKMKDEAKKAAQNKEKADALKKKIDQAKKDGKDAEALERELNQLKDEMKQSAETMDRMAERMKKMKEAMQKGDMQDAAEQLDGLAGDLKQIAEELKDLEDADDYLQRLKDEMKKACDACKGNKNGDELGHKDDAEWSEFTSPASGRRKENKDAKTASKDEKISGLFDPRGKKSFGGTVKGPAFTKRSNPEMGDAIKEAAQEAPQTPDVQRLPRDTQTAVKEYFEKIGRTGGDGKK